VAEWFLALSKQSKKPMKKIVSIAACLLFAGAAVHAQGEFINTTISGTAMVARASFASTYIHVYKSWAAMFGTIGIVDGTQLKDRTVLVRWKEGCAKYAAFFSVGGSLLRTVISYETDGLPTQVRDRVRSNYPDLRISYVNEVRTPGQDNVYRVQLEDDKQLVIMRATEDEMVEDQRYAKLK
jgi:hypothetical protein